MLDLHARVHLDEEELVVLVQELERAGAAVADAPAGLGGALADAQQRARADARRRRLLDDLLVAPLHRAVALPQVDRVLVLVGQHLDLDVARVAEEALHVDRRVAERRLRLGARERHRRQQRGLGVHDAHAASAAAARRLDDHRIADQRAPCARFPCASSGSAPSEPGTHGTPALVIATFALTLSPIRRIVSGLRADEHEAGALDLLGEVGVLGQEAVARVDRLRIGDLGRRDDRGDVEVALRRRRRPDAHRFVGERDVLRVAVGLGMHARPS